MDMNKETERKDACVRAAFSVQEFRNTRYAHKRRDPGSVTSITTTILLLHTERKRRGSITQSFRIRFSWFSAGWRML
jgi:hypothetical protein